MGGGISLREGWSEPALTELGISRAFVHSGKWRFSSSVWVASETVKYPDMLLRYPTANRSSFPIVFTPLRLLPFPMSVYKMIFTQYVKDWPTSLSLSIQSFRAVSASLAYSKVFVTQHSFTNAGEFAKGKKISDQLKMVIPEIKVLYL